MDLSNVLVIDIEADGLLDTVSKIHIMSVGYTDEEGKWKVKSTTDYDDMRKVMLNPDNVIVGHNFILYDSPSLEKVLGIEVKATLICTLGLSWALYPWKRVHGLEHWGEHFGVPKVEVGSDVWAGLRDSELSIINDKGNKTPLSRALCKMKLDFDSLMKERCEEDVKININLWITMLRKLDTLYRGDEESYESKIKYFGHKMNCIKVQEDNPLSIDVELCKKNLKFLEGVIEEKCTELVEILPKIPNTKICKKPKNPFKKDGSLSVAGEKWFDLLEKAGLPEDYEGDVEVTTGYSEPNPQSPTQIKGYLFTLGWKPKIFKKGANGKVPQVRDSDKNLCESIKRLIPDYPQLEALDGLSVAQHRVGILKGILDSLDKDNKVVARISKFAKTNRMAHSKPLVNLPKPSAKHGELIRSVIVAPEGYILCGSDISSLENKTLQNSIYHLDKEYVEEMNFPGFDSHLKLGKIAGLITEQEAEFFLWFKKFDKIEKEGDRDKIDEMLNKGRSNPLIRPLITEDTELMHNLYDNITEKRSVSKTSNYALTYNCAPKTLAESARISIKQAEEIHSAYWEMNWAVKSYTDTLKTKTVDGETWIYNPLSKMWLYLSSDHIKFSACNQNAGVYIFDLWVHFMMERGIMPSAQFHDEVIIILKPEDKEAVKRCLEDAMKEVNEMLDLPVPIEIDVQFGHDYGSIH